MPRTRSPAPVTRRRLSVSRARSWRQRWELQQSRLVPSREVRFDWILATLETAVGRRCRALDLGCGTGALAERILRRFPAARVVAIDHDPVLLAVGERGLGDVGGRLTWLDADLRSPTWTRGLPTGRFDAAVSSTALHWLTPGEVGALYRSLARRLRPGGIFLDADFLEFDAASRRLRRIASRLGRARRRARPAVGESWDAFWAAILRDPELTEEVALHRERYPHAHSGTPTPDLEGHRRLLRRAGFKETELFWSEGRSRILAAVR